MTKTAQENKRDMTKIMLNLTLLEAYQAGYAAGHADGMKQKAEELAASIEKLNFSRLNSH